jgi:uncharacterized RDD family membrane protein YckC
MQEQEPKYAGFWIRTGAAIIDTLLIMVISLPLLVAIYGWAYFDASQAVSVRPGEFLITWVLPAVAVIAFWIVRQATPGKMAVSTRIVDAETGQPASTRQLIGRYFAYYAACIPFGLGILWVAFDRRKQGWHDKLAGTVVVRRTRN